MSDKREHTFADSIKEVRRVSEDRARARDEEERERRIRPLRNVCLAAICRTLMGGQGLATFLDAGSGTLRYRLDGREYTITVTVEDA